MKKKRDLGSMLYERGGWSALTGDIASLVPIPGDQASQDAALILQDVVRMLPRVPGMSDEAHFKAAATLNGRNQHSEDVVNVDNVNVDQSSRPSGNSREQGLRRLAAAAQAGDDAAADNLRDVHEGRKSVNAACVEMGWRPAKIDKDVRDRAANEVAELLAEHVPAGAWDALKANLYASGAKHVANALTNILGNSVMDRGGWQ